MPSKALPWSLRERYNVLAYRSWRSISDNIAPTLSVVSPAAGSVLASSSTPIVVQVTDKSLESTTGVLKRALVWAQYSDDSSKELVWDGAAFTPKFSGGSVATTVAGGKQFSLVRVGGWRLDPTIFAYATDSFGNQLASASLSWIFTPAPPPPSKDLTVPVVTIVSPSSGSPVSATTPIVLNVTDNENKVTRVIISIAFSGSDVQELVWNGVAFVGPYSGSSSSGVITNGLSFTLLRRGGWRGSPSVRVHAADFDGNEAA